MSDPGHVFVVQSDLTALAVTDLIVPCDDRLNVAKAWSSVIGHTHPGDHDWVRPSGVDPPAAFGDRDREPFELRSAGSHPRTWMVNTAISGGRDVGWLVHGVRSAIRRINAEGNPADGRARRLIGLPLVGVGEGGFQHHLAGVISSVVEGLEAEATKFGAPDIVLALRSRADYAAVQSRRIPPVLPEGVDARVVGDLAARAARGELVLFLGAGVSQAAGLPGWRALLARLLDGAPGGGIDKAAVLGLPAPDAAEIVRRLYGNTSAGDQPFHDAVAQAVTTDRFAVAHALLASTGVREAVTTNYDTLYERAVQAATGSPPSVLPRERPAPDRPWLLKLHGDLDRPESIVLTREQYLTFDAEAAPLASVVQAAMVTRHLLFVGYSLSDDNFVRLARQVRRLLRSSPGSGPVGTVLTLSDEPLKRILWDEAVSYVPCGQHDNALQNARSLEIVLDYLAWACRRDLSYAMTPIYRDLLDSDDQASVQALQQLQAQLPRTGAVADAVRRLLESLGAPPVTRRER